MRATNNKPLETDETAPPVMPHTIRLYLLKAFWNFIRKNLCSLCHSLTYSWRPIGEGLQARAQHTKRAATYCVFGVVTNNTQPGLTLGRPELDNDGSTGRDICVAYEKQLDNLARTLESQHMDSHLLNEPVLGCQKRKKKEHISASLPGRAAAQSPQVSGYSIMHNGFVASPRGRWDKSGVQGMLSQLPESGIAKGVVNALEGATDLLTKVQVPTSSEPKPNLFELDRCLVWGSEKLRQLNCGQAEFEPKLKLANSLGWAQDEIPPPKFCLLTLNGMMPLKEGGNGCCPMPEGGLDPRYFDKASSRGS
ncbi:hypothetical protein B0H17DRAFT_1124956 [Mycena rosella]|uniref:Uncharacterized protein n=1 Tax=Mycena rosella TaxID=1033263 RepID=A0AAD7GYK8_MYCRO|nr:hypothetical protein B0H17DRAFT_1124956 [Mycena rosella]